MDDNRGIAASFAKKARNVKGVLQVALFGSVARGEDTPRSDIDIAVVYEGDEAVLRQELNRIAPERVQLTLVKVANLGAETELAGALSGEGLLLTGRPIAVTAKGLTLVPQVIVMYSQTRLVQATRVKLNRALFGSTSVSHAGPKTYRTVTKGFVAEAGVNRIARGVFLVQRDKAPKLCAILKRFGAEFKQITVWTY